MPASSSPPTDPTFLLDTDPQPTPPPIASSPPLHPSCAPTSSTPLGLDHPAWNSTTRLLARQAADHVSSLERAAVRDRLAHDPMAQHAIAREATRRALDTGRAGRVYATGGGGGRSGIPVLVDPGKVQAVGQRRAERVVDEAYLRRVREAKPTVAHFMGTAASSSSSDPQPLADNDFDYLLATVPLLKSIPPASAAKHHARPHPSEHAPPPPPVFVAHDILSYQAVGADGFADEY